MAKPDAAQRARAIYDRLMVIPRDQALSNNEWARKAGVNTSFFTNLKKGSEPSVGNLRAILNVVGVSLPEFFADEADGRLIPAPTIQELDSLFRQILPQLPKRLDRRSEFLAEAVQHGLALPRMLPSIVADQNVGEPGETQESGSVRAATN